MDNPSSTMGAADKRRRYVRGGLDWRHEMTYSFRDYENARLTTSLSSNLEEDNYKNYPMDKLLAC